jgi:hypothetical protein
MGFLVQSPLGHKSTCVFPDSAPLEHAAVRSPDPGRNHRPAWSSGASSSGLGGKSPTRALPRHLRWRRCRPLRGRPCLPRSGEAAVTARHIAPVIPVRRPGVPAAGQVSIGPHPAAGPPGAVCPAGRRVRARPHRRLGPDLRAGHHHRSGLGRRRPADPHRRGGPDRRTAPARRSWRGAGHQLRGGYGANAVPHCRRLRPGAGAGRAGAPRSGPRGRRRSSPARNRTGWRSCGRGGSGKRACRSTTPIPSADRTCRIR